MAIVIYGNVLCRYYHLWPCVFTYLWPSKALFFHDIYANELDDMVICHF